jgi:ribonuclease BN (tRNA processing enzyme)
MTSVDFDIWGCRGSRSLVPPRSHFGNNTSCYSVLDRQNLFILDGGRGLGALGHAMKLQPRFQRVRRIHVLVSHSHLDHWEGLKDAEWFWERNGALGLEIFGPEQALSAIRRGYQHPSYVPLETLAKGKLASIAVHRLRHGRLLSVGGWSIQTFPLNHYSGGGARRQVLDAFGFLLTRRRGPAVAYLCDHEPTSETRAMEDRVLRRANLAVLDAHFASIRSQAFGHGSVEHAAEVARRHSQLTVIAAHHGPTFSDAGIRAASRWHANGLRNFHLAVEGTTYRWRGKEGTFRRLTPAKR